VSGVKHGSGSGKSKKEAEQNAAREALEFLGVLPRTVRTNGAEPTQS
jgi:dsRNA-specific ribonuclease